MSSYFASRVYDLIDTLHAQGRLPSEIRIEVNAIARTLLTVEFIKSYLHHRHGVGLERDCRSRFQDMPQEMAKPRTRQKTPAERAEELARRRAVALETARIAAKARIDNRKEVAKAAGLKPPPQNVGQDKSGRWRLTPKPQAPTQEVAA
jgi:hypothetical protein